jgi:hypothetical protein
MPLARSPVFWHSGAGQDIFVKRFLKTLVFLVVALLLVVSGVDTALDRLAASPAQASYTLYGQNGRALLSYDGDLTFCPIFIHPARVTPRPFQSRFGFAPRA